MMPSMELEGCSSGDVKLGKGGGWRK